MTSADPTDPNAPAAVYVITKNTAAGSEYDAMLQIALPSLVNQAVYVTGLLEIEYKLVSESALLRIDQGVEFLMASGCTLRLRSAMSPIERANTDASEQQMIASQGSPAQWSASGCGFIIRAYINEVTTSGDIGLFSSSTTSKLADTFAAHTARQIRRRLTR
jgi:hypothetical protein